MSMIAVALSRRPVGVTEMDDFVFCAIVVGAMVVAILIYNWVDP